MRNVRAVEILPFNDFSNVHSFCGILFNDVVGGGGEVAASVQLVYCGRFIEVPVRARKMNGLFINIEEFSLHLELLSASTFLEG